MRELALDIRCEARQVIISRDCLPLGITNHHLTFRDTSYVFNSRHVESLLIRVPLPSVYIDGRYEGTWVVLKGGELLFSLNEFLHNKSPLLGMKFFTELEGMYYKDLHRKYQRRIGESYLSTIIFQVGTPDEALEFMF